MLSSPSAASSWDADQKSRNYRIAFSSFEALRDTLLYHFAKTSSQVGNVYKLIASPLGPFHSFQFPLSHLDIKR